MAQSPPNNGGSNTEFFRSDESMQGFEKIIRWLEYFCSEATVSLPWFVLYWIYLIKIFLSIQRAQKPTKEILCELLISFIRLQDDNLARKPSNSQIMRLPAHCFTDFKMEGTLCHIFAVIYEHKWTEIANHDCLQISKMIFQRLIDVKCIRIPNIFISPEISDNASERIQRSLSNLHCQITTDRDQATHIIYPAIDHTDIYARYMSTSDDRIMTHWCYLPPSYASWEQNASQLPANVLVSIVIHDKNSQKFIP